MMLIDCAGQICGMRQLTAFPLTLAVACTQLPAQVSIRIAAL